MRTPATSSPRALTPDGGAPVATPCDTDADCQGAGYAHCAEHECGDDECLVDSDCSAGSACLCNGDAGHSNALPGNRCVPASCKTDSDCTGAAYCVPSRIQCGSVTGLFCTSAEDTCVDPATDCSCEGDGECVYTPTVGHFVCGVSFCSG